MDNMFHHTGILDGADASQASIGQQLERRCVNYALRHNPPEKTKLFARFKRLS